MDNKRPVKPISRALGFWTLLILSWFCLYADLITAAAVYTVGALLFDAIKTIGDK
jgi:hypothetical protein